MKFHVSVIICTHNPREDYFARVISALRSQSLDSEQWELLVVDNLSENPVKEFFDFSWHPNIRVIREEQLGLTPARLRGIREANGSLLVFVDDDNVLDEDYLEMALRVGFEKPFLGSWSGQCRPGIEEEPPDWTRRYWGNLVIREFENDIWSNLPRQPETMPCGAGLCVRREVAQHYVQLHQSGARSMQLDRAGNSLLSGGDNDLAACACDVGLGIGLISALRLTHLIPPERFTVNYLSRLAEGIYYSSVILDAERGVVGPTRSKIGRFIDALRTLRLKNPHRRILAAAYRGRNQALSEVASGYPDHPQRFEDCPYC